MSASPVVTWRPQRMVQYTGVQTELHDYMTGSCLGNTSLEVSVHHQREGGWARTHLGKRSQLMSPQA